MIYCRKPPYTSISFSPVVPFFNKIERGRCPPGLGLTDSGWSPARWQGEAAVMACSSASLARLEVDGGVMSTCTDVNRSTTTSPMRLQHPLSSGKRHRGFHSWWIIQCGAWLRRRKTVEAWPRSSATTMMADAPLHCTREEKARERGWGERRASACSTLRLTKQAPQGGMHTRRRARFARQGAVTTCLEIYHLAMLSSSISNAKTTRQTSAPGIGQCSKLSPWTISYISLIALKVIRTSI